MTVDLSKIKPGDEVTVRCVVLNAQPDHDGDIKGDFGAGEDGDCPMHFKPDRIVSHTPKALAVGDRVKSRLGSGEVKHVIEQRAWVDWSTGQQLIHQLSDLEPEQ